MPPEGELKKRVVRRLTKKRKEGHQVTMEIPDRFKDGDDADEDCTAPKGQNIYLNQSVFGMIAAAGGSQVDFNARFDGPSSDDEESGDTPPRGEDAESSVSRARPGPTDSTPDKHRQFSERKLMRSLPHLNIRPFRSKSRTRPLCSPLAESQELDGKSSFAVETASKGPPIMGRMLEAQAELSSRPSFDLPRQSSEKPAAADSDGGPSSLAKRLMEIFSFDGPEEVIEEYPCWLLKSVLLQGYMYITTKHICFYAYLPKKSNVVAKSGYLSKRGLKNPKYHRYWFRLKGDVLSYHTDPSDLYFPNGNIDLRYGISASIADKEKDKDTTYFTVVTDQRKFYFKADSAPSAKEWVKALQKIIFRSHNEGDSVKISLPILDVIDVEDSQVVEFAETCKIRVIDNDETYAIDEYFFSFFSFGKEALNVLRILVEGTTAKQLSEEVPKPRVAASGSNGLAMEEPKRTSNNLAREFTPILGDQLKATPRSGSGSPSPRTSGDFSRGRVDGRRNMDLNRILRRSVDLNPITDTTTHSTDLGHFNLDGQNRSSSASRRSLSRTRRHDKPASEKRGSSDSYVHSLEEPGSSAVAQSTSGDTQGSASQILRGSEVFFSPTIRRSFSASRQRDEDSSLGTRAISRSPTRASTICMPRPRHVMTTGSTDGCNVGAVEPINSGNSLQSFVKAGAYPLQRAAGFASYLNQHSKRMSSILATESMGYVEKVSGMWKGGKKHYDEPHGVGLDDPDDDGGDQGITTKDRFRGHFALPASEKLQATYFGYLHRVLPLYGKIYVSNRSFCFRSMLPSSRTKLILPLKDIENVDKEKGFRFGYSGLVIVIKGHEELFFEFGQPDTRDDCAITLLQNLETIRYLQESGLLSQEEKESAEAAVAEHEALQEARQDGNADNEIKFSQGGNEARNETSPILFDDPRASILNFKPIESLRITCLTIGSRGDVQPYIALCKGLIAEGHRPKIATHNEFKDWVESYGIEFAPVAGDPAELIRICVENGMFTYSFLKEASSKFRVWIDELLSSAWRACQNTDILIESPSAMGGIHIAEALEIPYFRAFSMPWTRTRAYPHAFAVPEHKMGGAYNYITYVMFDNVFWKAIAGQINRWRKKDLGLQRTSLEKMQPNKVPFLYNVSPSVVVPPIDYSDWIRITGYWYLNEGENWAPPKELADFIAKARADKKKIVYIGFGSIVVSDSAALTRTVVKSVEKADVRCILSKGWSDRLDKEASDIPEVPLSDDIFLIKSAPHDWLFQQVDAAVHHGGAGTTGASLRAGLPTIVKPFFGDQFFSASRVEDLGVGIYLRKLNVSVFSRALWEACHSERIITKVKLLAEQIRMEDGVGTAIQSIYRDLEYAKSLIKKKVGKVSDDVVEDSESWTFIGDDNDPELAKRIHDWELMAQSSARTGKDPLGNRALRAGSGAGIGSGVPAPRVGVGGNCTM